MQLVRLESPDAKALWREVLNTCLIDKEPARLWKTNSISMICNPDLNRRYDMKKKAFKEQVNITIKLMSSSICYHLVYSWKMPELPFLSISFVLCACNLTVCLYCMFATIMTVKYCFALPLNTAFFILIEWYIFHLKMFCLFVLILCIYSRVVSQKKLKIDLRLR